MHANDTDYWVATIDFKTGMFMATRTVNREVYRNKSYLHRY